ncbi:TP53-target gene 5 protein [Lacerta agilis]|uniref:TP53-target gene 5 protein n=1 Tax=Lacerta agilis TaxID=80427 RepID=UPI0014191343|nr:TP53-target gene 5 protein [Lacerta agilis]
MKALEKKKQCPKINDVESGASQTSNLIHVRSHLRRIIKKLVLLKMLKSPNRRIEWLCELAHKYRKMLAIGGDVDSGASCSWVCTPSEEPPAPNVSVIDEPAMEVEEVAKDKAAEPKSSTEATSPEPASSELYEALSLKGLPHRIHMPARRVLCRPSNLRWVKPCCTRSCSETLEHVVTIPYSECQKRHPSRD